MKNKGTLLHPQLTILMLSCIAAGAVVAADTTSSPGTDATVGAASEREAGRYLVVIGGCNDCHTAGWPESGGKVPEDDWLTGVPVGFRGPWGTTYPSNLRLLVDEIEEDAWVAMFRTRNALPPMPWMNLNQMSEPDARAMYRFIRSLGKAGARMPTAVAPGVEPETPYIDFTPQHMERLQAPPTGVP